MNTLQRNDDWHAQRCGKITASRIKDMGAKPSKGKCYNALALTILSERLTGVQEETKTTGPMQWGIDQEQFAVIAYENETGSFVTDVGLIDHPAIKMSGASPDGLVGKNGQLEIKCPSTTTHLNTILMQEVPEEHIPQITWQLACTRREWCDFVSYDPRLPEHLQLF
ncbi:MAG: YqaJ viral recombinase family protein, partial [Acinetobacter sp.]